MPELTFDQQIVLWLIFAALSSLMGRYFGWKYPGERADSRARQVWAWADIGWLLVAVFTIAKIMGPVGALLRDGDSKAASSTIALLQQQVVQATWKAQDSLCGDALPRDGQQLATCAVLRKVERQYTKGSFDHIDALVIGRDFIPLLCQPGRCPPELLELKNAVSVYRKVYLENAARLGKGDASRESEIVIPYLNLVLFILAFGLRFGRSVAEVRRNALAARPRSGALPHAQVPQPAEAPQAAVGSH
jgi:hypothetical protein